jgi:hypothetical protein
MRGRVRWGNVGRAVGTVALVALVVAWPRLGGDALVAPDDSAMPLATPRPAPATRATPTGPGTAQVGKVRERAGAGHEAARSPRKPAPEKRVVKPRPRESEKAPPHYDAPPVSTPAPPAPPPPPPPAPRPVITTAPPPPAPTIDPAEREFGFER